MTEWQGRTAVITGGGRGFGRALGETLAAAGGHAVLIDIRGGEAESAAAGIRAAGGLAEGLAGDVTDEARGETLRVTGGMAAGV